MKYLILLCCVTSFLKSIYLPLMHLKILKFINFVKNYNFSDKKKKAQHILGNHKLEGTFSDR